MRVLSPLADAWPTEAQPRMNRFYAAEPTPTVTGSNADHRLPISAHDVANLAQALASRLGVGEGGAVSRARQSTWLDAAARDLQNNRGASVIIAGETQPPEVHALVQQMNSRAWKHRHNRAAAAECDCWQSTGITARVS